MDGNTFHDVIERVTTLVPGMQRNAAALDEHGIFPAEDMAAIGRAGALSIPLPIDGGHERETSDILASLLTLIGSGNLSVGRLFEAHVNALHLIGRYGTASQITNARQAAAGGELHALWVTDPAAGALRLIPFQDRWKLDGSKMFCSAAGHAAHAVLLAATASDEKQMLIVPMARGERAELLTGKMQGMRSAVTGKVDFSGVEVGRDAFLGHPGDYMREPDFSCGAWRASAVAHGGLCALLDVTIDDLRARDRIEEPNQLARIGQAMIARETSRLWVPMRPVSPIISEPHPGMPSVMSVWPALRWNRPVWMLCVWCSDHWAYQRSAMDIRQNAFVAILAHISDNRLRMKFWPKPHPGSRAMIRADELRRNWRSLPLGNIDTVTGPGGALILAPHADDESLGCGGLIAACCQLDRPPIVAILHRWSDVASGIKGLPRERLIQLRETEARNAASVLGLAQDRLIFLREPDTNAPREGDAFNRVVEHLTGLVRRFGCSGILAPWQFDPHCDHEAASRIASEVARKSGVRHVAYPVWGWTLPSDHIVNAETTGGWRLDITCHLTRKLKAIAAHQSQYGGLITDDPSGFRLPAELLGVFASSFETFLLP